MLVTISTLVLASVLYVIGGIAMKYSEGLQVGIPTALVFCFFCAGAALQTVAMKKTELGGGYIFVLGLEAVLAVLAGAAFFQETLTLSKVIGALFVVAGIFMVKL